jgi:Tfp pilus assembly protein PilF
LLRLDRDDLDADDPDVDGIAEALGDLPLALHLAGSYLREYQGEAYATPAAYLAEITGADRLEHASLTGTVDGQSPTDHDRHVGKTFLASLNRLDPRTPVDALALRVLGRAAALAPGEPIPRELLRADTAGDEVSPQRADRDALNLTLRLGLLTGGGESAVEMHRLAGHFVRANVKTAGQDRDAVIEALSPRLVEINNPGLPAPMAPFLPHLRHLAESTAADGLEQAGGLLNNLGYHLLLVADLAGAKAAFERALAIGEAALGPDHPNVAIWVNNLGGVLQEQGDLNGAKSAYKRALAIDEAAYGLDHPNVATRVNNLGGVLQEQGDLDGANAAYKRALAINEAALGPDHPNVASGISNLGSVLRAQGDLDGAKAAFERALAIGEAAFGPDHPTVAIKVNNLGSVLREQGDLDGAKAAFERALRITETTFGPDHPTTNIMRENLRIVEGRR